MREVAGINEMTSLQSAYSMIVVNILGNKSCWSHVCRLGKK